MHREHDVYEERNEKSTDNTIVMMALLQKNKKRTAVRSVFVLLASATIIVLLYPFMPSLDYFVRTSSLFNGEQAESQYPVILSTPHYVLVGTAKEKEEGLINSTVRLDTLHDTNLQSRPIVDPALKKLVIPEIGVEMPVIITGDEYKEEDAYSAMDRGAWLYTKTSTPDAGSNTVLTGHRFKYMPPHHNTLYSLDKIQKGDEILIYWQGREYMYRVNNSKVVEPTDLSVLDSTPTPTLTIITCTPLFSTAQRLVVTADLIGVR